MRGISHSEANAVVAARVTSALPARLLNFWHKRPIC
jgi:hypothetical protein